MSDQYIAQAKPAGYTLDQGFRRQAKATFDAALATGRTPYFYFDGPPDAAVIRALNRYAAHYGIQPVIDIGSGS